MITPVAIQAAVLFSLQPARVLLALLPSYPARTRTDINQHPHSSTTNGEELQNARADIAEVEAINAEKIRQHRTRPNHNKRRLACC